MIESTRSASPMPATVQARQYIAYRPVTHWTTEASASLRVHPVRVRGWARVYPERVSAMLRAQVLCGNRALAESWMTQFEGAFISTPDSWEAAHSVAVVSDAEQNVRSEVYAVTRTPEEREVYKRVLRREISDKQRELRALEAE